LAVGGFSRSSPLYEHRTTKLDTHKSNGNPVFSDATNHSPDAIPMKNQRADRLLLFTIDIENIKEFRNIQRGPDAKIAPWTRQMSKKMETLMLLYEC